MEKGYLRIHDHDWTAEEIVARGDRLCEMGWIDKRTWEMCRTHVNIRGDVFKDRYAGARQSGSLMFYGPGLRASPCSMDMLLCHEVAHLTVGVRHGHDMVWFREAVGGHAWRYALGSVLLPFNRLLG